MAARAPAVCAPAVLEDVADALTVEEDYPDMKVVKKAAEDARVLMDELREDGQDDVADEISGVLDVLDGMMESLTALEEEADDVVEKEQEEEEEEEK